MSKARTTYDDRELRALLDRLTGGEVLKAGETGARRGAAILSRATYANFSRLHTKHNRGSGVLRDRQYSYGGVAGKRLKTVTIRNPKTVSPTKRAIYVNIQGDFVGVIMEGGTARRYTTSRRARGSVRRVVVERYISKSRKTYGQMKTRRRVVEVRRRSGRGRYTGRILRGRYFERAILSTREAVQRATNEGMLRALIRLASKR